MCTVTFLRAGGKTIITSNRDEQIARPASPPQAYQINAKTLYFPKDNQSGGTWYAVSDSGTVLVLLNGAAEKHHHQPPYRKSRGLIVLDIIGSASALEGWQEIGLDQIEPFTLVLFENEALYQLRWDGQQKDTLKLNTEVSHIWSSATLYPADVRQQRAGWFSQFLSDSRQPSPEQLYRFHRYTRNGDQQNGLVIDRSGLLKTLSITQTVIQGDAVQLTHYDLQQEQQFTHSFRIS